MSLVELRPIGSTPVTATSRQLVWGSPGSSESNVASTVDAWLTQVGAVPDRAIDIVRIAAGAYMADRLSQRPITFCRTMRLHVQLVAPALWTPLIPRLERLLSWISGDVWSITVSGEAATRPPLPTGLLGEPAPEVVALLSGGLDSFCGSILATDARVYVSHTDNPTVTGAQTKAWNWLSTNNVAGERVRVPLTESAGKRESTTRTRALLFYALAIAVADTRGASRVEVPENGFTSLNLSLGRDRGGPLSTRSTHPWTMHLIQELLDAVDLDVTFVNPYEWLTKGELVGRAAERQDALADGLSRTLSCAKLDGRLYKGGNPNWNCGLCVACMTRRASVRAAGLVDGTPYLATELTGPALAKLRSNRSADVAAMRSRVQSDIDEFALLESGPYPADYDLVRAADLCRRGFAELAALLPELS